MNKIKDIIYDKSDILIAILILALAAIIILWRLGIILEYPKQIVGTDDTTNVLTDPENDSESGDATETDSGDSGDATETGDGEDSGDATETGDGEDTGDATETGDGEDSGDSGDATETGDGEDSGDATETGDGEDSSESSVTTKAQWDGNKLAKDLEVTITGTTASAAVQCMVDAGIYADYADYQKVCQENGWDHEKMRAGVFTFKKGTSKKDITREVNWS